MTTTATETDSLRAQVESIVSSALMSQVKPKKNKKNKISQVVIPTPEPIELKSNDDDEDLPKRKDVVFFAQTPELVSKLLNSGMTEKQTVAALVKASKKDQSVLDWASLVEARGRPKTEFAKYFAVKKAVKAALGIKTAPNKVKNNPEQLLVDTDFSALEVSSTPLKKFTSPGGDVFLLWTDFLAAKDGAYSLRFRRFSAGENSKAPKGPPNVYLIEGETTDNFGKVVAKMNAKQFLALLGFVTQLSTSGKMTEIFKALTNK